MIWKLESAPPGRPSPLMLSPRETRALSLACRSLKNWKPPLRTHSMMRGWPGELIAWST